MKKILAIIFLAIIFFLSSCEREKYTATIFEVNKPYIMKSGYNYAWIVWTKPSTQYPGDTQAFVRFNDLTESLHEAEYIFSATGTLTYLVRFERHLGLPTMFTDIYTYDKIKDQIYRAESLPYRLNSYVFLPYVGK